MSKTEVYRILKNILSRNLKFTNDLLIGRTYYCTDFISLGDSEKDLKDKELDVAIVLEDSGLTISTSRSSLMKKILDKLNITNFSNIVNLPKSLSIIKNKDSSFTISYPKLNNVKDWEKLVIGLSNLCLMASITNSSKIIFYIVLEEKAKDSRLKLFSFSLISKVVTAFNVIYNFLIYRPLGRYLRDKLTKEHLSPANEKAISAKLINYIKSLRDLYSVNIGDSTYFLCIKSLKSLRFSKEYIDSLKKEGADPRRLRTVNDWIVKAYNDDKDLIVYSDLDSYVSIAHEIGHYELSKEGILGNIQNHCKFHKSRIVDIVNFFIGYSAGATKNVETIAIGTLVNFVLHTPQLAIEFLASYRGIKLLERLGVDKEVIKKSRAWLGYAYLTYINGALARSGKSITAGAGLGLIRRSIFK
jgi:hypothetical protein